MILRQNSLKDICSNAHTVYWIFIESTIRCGGLYHVLHRLLSSEFTHMCRQWSLIHDCLYSWLAL